MSRAATLAAAKEIAHRVNYDHALSRDERYALSMRLSLLQRALGARGVDRAWDDAEASDVAADAD